MVVVVVVLLLMLVLWLQLPAGLLLAGGLVGKGLGCQAAGRVVMGVCGVGWWTGTNLQGPYWMDTAARGGHSIGSGDATGIAGCEATVPGALPAAVALSVGMSAAQSLRHCVEGL